MDRRVERVGGLWLVGRRLLPSRLGAPKGCCSSSGHGWSLRISHEGAICPLVAARRLGRSLRPTSVAAHDVFQRVFELAVEILPLAHPEVGEEVLFAELPPRALGAERFPLVVNGVPDVEQREEVRLRIGEPAVRRSGRVFLVERTFARVLDAEAGRDDEQLA